MRLILMILESMINCEAADGRHSGEIEKKTLEPEP